MWTLFSLSLPWQGRDKEMGRWVLNRDSQAMMIITLPLTHTCAIIISASLGNSLAVGQRILDPPGKVRILLPQPYTGNKIILIQLL